MEELKILVVEPNKTPKVQTVPNTLEAMQKIVGGYIENTFPFKDAVCLVCNELGKIQGLPLNRSVGNDVIVGTFFIAGLGEEDFVSLTDSQLEKYSKQFAAIEIFAGENTKLDMEFMKVVAVKPIEELNPDERRERRDIYFACTDQLDLMGKHFDSKLFPLFLQDVLAKHNPELIRTCLAQRIVNINWDGRLSDGVKHWAKNIMDDCKLTKPELNLMRLSDVHPVILNEFATMVMAEVDNKTVLQSWYYTEADTKLGKANLIEYIAKIDKELASPDLSDKQRLNKQRCKNSASELIRENCMSLDAFVTAFAERFGVDLREVAKQEAKAKENTR